MCRSTKQWPWRSGTRAGATTFASRWVVSGITTLLCFFFTFYRHDIDLLVALNVTPIHQAASPAACSGKALRSLDAKKAVAAADGMLTQRNVEAELFRGRRLSEKSNREKLDAFAAELVKEQERRARSPGLLPTVVIKQAPTATPRPSSATTASSATATGRTASTMPSPASQDSYQH